jgi:uncharacterized membrane protein YedE/YeeE
MAEVSGLLVSFVALVAVGWRSLRTDSQDFGILAAVALRLGLFEAKGVVDEVREHFIRGDGGLDQAMAFKDSYTPTFNMVGVAGAILAQIALTALGLLNLDDTHWTARASFVIGLVAGSLAVFCSCVLQSKMSALHNAHAVRRWLTRPRSGSKMHVIARGISALNHFSNSDTTDLAHMKEMLSYFNEAFNERAYRPSLSAALILTAPSQLLSIALGSLLTGFGIYFGFVYSAGLPAIEDHHSALAVLVVYIAGTVSGLLLFFLPVLVKLVAASGDREMGGSLDEVIDKWEIAIEAAQQADAVSKQDGVLSALNGILDVQEKQLQLQENFKAVLEAHFQTPSL